MLLNLNLNVIKIMLKNCFGCFRQLKKEIRNLWFLFNGRDKLFNLK